MHHFPYILITHVHFDCVFGEWSWTTQKNKTKRQKSMSSHDVLVRCSTFDSSSFNISGIFYTTAYLRIPIKIGDKLK